MKKVLRWVILVWAIIGIPYMDWTDVAGAFYGLLFLGLIIGVMISDLRK